MSRITEIDLNNTTEEGNEDLCPGPTYVALINGAFEKGVFGKQWFGLVFHGTVHLQYDPPSENFSPWQRVWRVDDTELTKWSGDAILMLCGLDPEKITTEGELPYAERRRAYAISHKMTRKGVVIDETTPVEAYFYNPKDIVMPDPKADLLLDDEDDDWDA